MKASSRLSTVVSSFFFGLFVVILLSVTEIWAGTPFRIKISPVIPRRFVYHPEQIFGALKWHRVKKKETLLDVAREYGLGYNEIIDLYPEVDPWSPPEGKELIIPSRWILPDSSREGIVINIAEMRLFYFVGSGERQQIMTFPIGIGDFGFPTPEGRYIIRSKRENPSWFIPPSLQEKYGRKVIPPGPDNPLGAYWMRLDDTMYGIHGTDIPWSVGRLVTHGCIRLYPEDIENLYPIVNAGTKVNILYEPVKIAFSEGKVHVEVHRDVYNKIDDFVEYGEGRLIAKGGNWKVDRQKFLQALKRRDGMPVDVTGADPL